MEGRSVSNILVIDIETAPNIAMVWSTGKQFVGHAQILEERKIVCISYKWIGKDKIYNVDWGLRKQCDKKMLEHIIPVIEKADLIVGQNHERFDIKWINTRIAYHALDPINIKTLTLEDTMKLAKNNFYLNSNSMDYMSDFFGVEQKKDGGGWGRIKKIVIDKDKKALQEHIEYCNGDIRTTEALFERMKPYVDLKKSLSVLRDGDRDGCPCCSSFDKIKWGYYTSKIAKYPKYKCRGCGHVWRDSRKV